MALINCPECGTQVSTRAEKCLKCGYPISVQQSSPQQRNYDPQYSGNNRSEIREIKSETIIRNEGGCFKSFGILVFVIIIIIIVLIIAASS